MKKALSVVLALVILLSVFSALPMTAHAETSGTCGEHLEWKLSDSGVLTISGTGDMYDWYYDYIPYIPWYSNRERIKKVSIGPSVTRIGEYAFYGCTGLASVIIGNSVTSIGHKAFDGCESLTSINIPASVTEICYDCNGIEGNPFSRCSSLKSITVDQDNPVYDNRGNCNAIIETETNKLRAGCQNTIIPDSVTCIGDSAFNGCMGLENITIPNCVTCIEDFAFYGCTSLQSITIPDSVTNLGLGNGTCNEGCVFAKCTSLKSVTLGKSVRYIIFDTFWDCSSLTDITISSSVEGIREYAFAGCTSLQNITIPDSVKFIEWDAFYGCTSLTSVSIGRSVSEIDHPFSGCTSLNTITVSKDNPTFDSRDNCNAIIDTDNNILLYGCKNTVIPDSVRSIGDGAFSGCTGLTSIVIPGSVMYFCDGAFFGCTGLTSIEIPDSVTYIGKNAFSNCSGLTSIYIPASVTKIDYYSTWYTTRPAFDECNNLSDLYYGGSEEEWNSHFDRDTLGLPESTVIHYNCAMPGSAKFTVLGEEFTHDLSYFANHWDSTQYNPELAHLMMTFANAAYEPKDVAQGYNEIGMNDWLPKNYDKTGSLYGTDNVCFSIGSKENEDGTICVLLALRGSGSLFDVSQGTLDWLGNLDLLSASTTTYSPHQNFYMAANHVYEITDTYLYDKYGINLDQCSNVKFFITGHSRGAAVANLVEYKLEAKVGKQNLYGYNFAVPDTGVVSKGTNEKDFNNIFNISNLRDPVGYLPGRAVDIMFALKQWLESGELENEWKKWGISVWFGGGVIVGSAHAPDKYLEYMRQRKPLSSYTDDPKINFVPYINWFTPWNLVNIKIYATYCPVDVELVDENGKVVASVIDGVVDYHGTHFGDVIISTQGEHKVFAVPADSNYTLRIAGSDEGTMDYYVADYNMITDETSSVKAIEGVTLENGKQMYSPIADYLDAADTQLFVVGEGDAVTQEILSDGSEVNPVLISENHLEPQPGDVITLTAESMDAYRWYSTDDSVAVVEDGEVTVKAFGKANIVAETASGARAICTVEVSQILGDTDGDGMVTVIDATNIQRVLADYVEENYNAVTADVDGDGEVTIIDASYIQRYLADLPMDVQGIGKPI